jgi:3-hydroxyisobutyrate dehydrogenase
MCGGRADAIEAARAVMEAYTKRIVHVGKAGAGQTTKMVNQIAFSGIIATLSEALRFAEAAHLDLEKVYQAISGGASQSWQMDNRWKTMCDDSFDFGFAVDWMRKDMGLALEEGRSLGVSLPVAALIDQFFAEVQAIGGGRQDTSALVRRLPHRGSI